MKPDKVSKERQRELDEDLYYQQSGLSPEFGAETARNLRKDRLKREAREAERCSMKLNATRRLPTQHHLDGDWMCAFYGPGFYHCHRWKWSAWLCHWLNKLWRMLGRFVMHWLAGRKEIYVDFDPFKTKEDVEEFSRMVEEEKARNLHK